MSEYNLNAENVTGSAVGDNAKVYNHFHQQKPDFAKFSNLDDFQSPYFPRSKNASDVLKNLRTHRVLILGGNHEDKSNLALHFACILQEQLSATVWEWNGNASPQSLLAEIRGEQTASGQNTQNTNRIFILSNLLPQHINNQIQSLQSAAKGGNNYVIATTDVPIDQWIFTNQSVFWNTTTKLRIYQPEDLAEALIQKLINQAISLDEEREKSLRQIVGEKLKKVAEIEYCIQLLLTQKQITKETIKKAVNEAISQNRENSLKQWFNSLENREKLLLLGLSFFDGLFEDQFFAALETVVREVWQQRDPTLVAIDYQDLEKIYNYYELVEKIYQHINSDGFKVVDTKKYPTEFAISKIEIRNNNDRQQLLKVAWKTHRRQIMNALGAIVTIVKESVEKQLGNWELYGNLSRRNLLHNTVSQTLYCIGLGETSAAIEVRTPLLELASHEAVGVKNVAAQAIAQWYIYGSTQEKSSSRDRFFGTLTNFWNIATQKQEDVSETEEWRENIGATVAMTISYAARNASSDEFKTVFFDWLKELSIHPSKIIRLYFGYHTLSYLVPIYLNELQEILKEWTQNFEELNHPIAVALARAYKDNPDNANQVKVKTLLENWYKEAKNLSKDTSDIKKARLLATVALTYGEIEYEN